ncbi:MAG: hypothetical protein ACM3SP_05820 [Chloroflexota bacterium]
MRIKGPMTTKRRESDMPNPTRIGLAIFVLLFVCYGYFFQGGGWNQNSRFDQIRAIVEQQELDINNYLVYQANAVYGGDVKILRLPSTEVDGNLISANSLDITRFAGKFYPNKPPGTVFLALPAYGFIYRLETMFGLDADGWWVQTFNVYFVTVFTVGLISALGGVVLFFLSRRLFPETPPWTHLATTLAYGLGTLIWPFATLLFDHNLVATLSLCAFALLLVEAQGGSDALRPNLAYFLAGFLCGLSIVVNYVASITSVCLFFYGISTTKRRPPFIFAGLAGSAVPIISLLWYHNVCFGSPLATANSYQFGMFQSADAVLFGMLTLPNPVVAFDLLFPYYRGLFFTSPVLLLTGLGLVIMANNRSRRPEAILFASIFAAYLLMNSAFNHWEAGWTAGPRYLIPALPFLALPGALVFTRLPRLTGALALASICMMLLITSVDPQVPTAVRNPLYDHALRLILGRKLEVNGINIEGPLSANPIGVYESWNRPAGAVSAAQRRWHSFNLGEFVWPNSLWSLSPLIMFVAGAILYISWVLKKIVANRPTKLCA